VRRLLALGLISVTLAGCGAVAITAGTGTEAPADCGFPPGTPLEFAGRSTTAALGVQEVAGDPMSDDPADIYITRDRFEQGELHGRLVCAIYINDPGFVEITVHPADGGGVIPEPEPPPVGPSLGPNQVEIVTHCGLDFPRIEWDGTLWKFDIEDPQPNPPWGWANPTDVITIEPGPDGPIAIGPDGSRWQLIPAVEHDGDMCM
jgi:hypothetical protein